MPIPASALDGIDFNPPKDAPNDTQTATPDQGPVETGTSYVVRKGTQEFGKGIGRIMNASAALQYGEALPLAAMRLFLPKDVVDFISPWSKIKLTNKDGKSTKTVSELTPDFQAAGSEVGAQTGANVVNKLGGTSPNLPDIGAAPGPISKNLGDVSGFVGAGLSQPLMGGTTFTKYLMSLIGTGELSALGGDIGKGVTSLAGGGEGAQKVGEGIGAFAGGMVGAPANVIRTNAISEALSAPWALAKRVSTSAVSAAKKAWADDASKSFFGYLSDDYTHLRDDAKNALQKRVITDVANDIRMDPDAPDQIKAFADAADKAGVNVDKFNIGQRSSTPSLVGTISQLRPQTPEDVALVANASKGSQKEIIEAAKRISKDTINPNADTVLGQLKDYQKTGSLRVQGLNDEANTVAATTPALSPDQKYQQGQKMYQLYEKELADAKVEKDRVYNSAKDLADSMGVDYDLKGVTKGVGDILKATFSKIDPSTAPQSLTNIKNLFSRKPQDEGFNQLVEGMNPEVKQWFTSEYNVNQPIRLRDVNDAVVALNDDIRSATKGTDSASRVEVANLTKVRQALENVIEEQSPPEVVNAYNEAVKHFKEVYVPRFREGVNLNLSKEKGPSAQGEQKIDPMGFLTSYLTPEARLSHVSETKMQQFDNLFGGVLPGTKRVDDAYNVGLWDSVQDAYATKVLGTKDKFDANAHEKFINDYSPALDRIPALRDKLDENASKIIDLQSEKDRVAEQYKAVTNSPLTQALGPQNAAKVLSDALADPRKMGQLISSLNKGDKAATGEGSKAVIRDIMMRAKPWKETSDGLEYDPQKLINLLDSGKADSYSVGGLQVAFRAAFGKQGGDEHLDRLRAIALLAQREALTNPRFLRPQEPFPDDLLKNVTGQTAASWITAFKAMAEGRVSDTYFASVGASRFLNNKLKASTTAAQQKALFDPEYSKAILELAATPGNQPINRGPVMKILGTMGEDGKEFAKTLLEHGMIQQHMFNGARVLAAVKANEDKNSKSQRERFSNEPYINRMEK